MKVVCEDCGKIVPAVDMDLGTGLAKCRSCDSAFELRGAIRRGASGTGRPRLRDPEGTGEGEAGEADEEAETEPGPGAKPEVPVPEGYRLEALPRGVRIEWKWFGLAGILLVPFMLFWNGFMVVWHGIALATGMWFLSLAGLLHTAVGFGLAYVTLALLFNRTSVEIERGVLRIANGPLPWPGNRELDASRVRQLYVKRVEQRTKHGPVSRYEVHAVLVDDTHLALVTGLDSHPRARFLEQELERALAIEDREVAEEHR